MGLKKGWETGTYLFSCIPPGKERRVAREAFRSLMYGAHPSEWTDITVSRANGETVFLEWRPVPFSDRIGRVSGLLATASEMDRDPKNHSLRDSKDNLRSLVEDAPISIWEEDYSEVKDRLNHLKEEGVEDFDSYFDSHPDELKTCARLVRVVNLNASARASMGISESDPSPELDTAFSKETYSIFKDQLLAMVRGETRFSGESISTAGEGTPRHYMINWTVMPGHEKDYSRVFITGSEITDVKHAEAALRQSEDKFALAFRASPDALCITSMADDHFIEVNDSFLHIMGYDRDEVIGSTFRNLNFWANSNEFLEFSRRMRVEGGVRDFRARFLRRNGESIIMAISSEPIVLEGRACLLSIARDVSQLESARQALKDSEEKYRHLVENNPSMITHTTPSGEILFINRAFPGFSIDQMIGANIFDFLQDEFHEHIRAVFEQVAKKGVTSGFEAAIEDPTGDAVWLKTFISPIYHEKSLDSLLLVSHDKTEARKIESALRESEKEYRTLVEAATDAIFIVQDNVIRFCNSSLLKISGYPMEEVMGKPFLRFVSTKDRERITQIHQMRQQGKEMPRRYEAAVVSRGGALVNVEINVADYSFQGRPAYLIIMRDITERHELEARMRQAQKIEVVGQLAGGVAHDFNNLLTVISGYSQMIQADQNLDETLRQRVELIRRAGDRAQSLTNQLLAFSRKQIAQPESMDLNHVIRESIHMLSSLIPEDIRIVLNLEAKLPNIIADPHQIEQVLINLVVNARDAIEEKGDAHEEPRIEIATGTVYLDGKYVASHPDATSGPAVAWSVSDTGTGMERKVRTRIFEPFYTTKEMGRGTGLGLSSVYGIVKQNRADITLSSIPGEGSTFRIFWPMGIHSGSRSSGVHEPRYVGGNETILLVEEDHEFRHFLTQELHRMGYNVLEVDNGREALQVIEDSSRSIDLMIMDLDVAGTTSRGLVAEARERRAALPIICSAGYCDDLAIHPGPAGEGIILFRKPCLMSDLALLIRSGIEGEPDE